MEPIEVFSQYRPLLFAIAYRMLGTVMEAEDVLQEAYIRWQAAFSPAIESPQSYLSAIVTRLSIDHLRASWNQREEYIGPWLPEPLLSDPAPGPDHSVALSESVSTAFLLLLESLKPVDRAVFLLREVFDYPYADIAGIVGKSEANCRQIVSRARRTVVERRPHFEAMSPQHSAVAERFMQTLMAGDIEGLLTVLDREVTWWSDGGGMPGVARKPIRGAEKVARFVLKLVRRAPPAVDVRQATINGGTGFVIYVDGHPFNTLSLEIVAGRIRTVFAVVHPDKLRHLPRLD